jgi:hypothetical protein
MLGVLAPAACAQSIWLDRTEPKSVHLELAKPMFDGPGDGFFTLTGYFATRLRLGERMSFVGELPVATVSLESSSPFFDDEWCTTIGNPYFGIESHPAGGTGGWFELGVRVPLVSDEEEATFTGLITDNDRWEAFFPDAFVLRTAGHWRDDPRQGGVGADFRVAPSLWVSDDFADDVEIFTTYGVQILFHSEEARAGIGLGGRWLTTEDGDFGDNSTHQFDAAVDFLPGKVRPGATLRIPLDEDNFFTGGLDAVVGVSLNIVLD